MFDDVIGLVMVQIISNLGGSGNSFDAVTVIRPLFVSIGFGVGVVVLCAFVARPILLRILAFRDRLPKFTGTPEFAFIGYTCFLMMLVAATTYAGTSSLFAAYLAGVTQTTSNEGKHPQQRAQPEQATTSAAPSEPPHLHKHVEVTGLYVYEHYYHGPVKRILIPMFFVSCPFPMLTRRHSDSRSGFDWLCDSNHGDVPRKCRVARYSVRHTDGFRKAVHRDVAGSVPAYCQSPSFGSHLKGAIHTLDFLFSTRHRRKG
jgi:hypothetical protein